MTNQHEAGHSNNGNNSANLNASPHSASLCKKKSIDPFSAENAPAGIKQIVKLTVELPLKSHNNHPNDVGLYFKRFSTALI